MQTRWLDCVYITLRSDHDASSTTSEPGHADRITFRSETRLHLSFQCVCGQHPDTGRMLMPSVNAEIYGETTNDGGLASLSPIAIATNGANVS